MTSNDLKRGADSAFIDGLATHFARKHSELLNFPEIAYARLLIDKPQTSADPIVQSLIEQAWDGDEPLNAYDDAERIVAIVREAIKRQAVTGA